MDSRNTKLNPDVSPWAVKGDGAYCEYCGNAYSFCNDMRQAHAPNCEWRKAFDAAGKLPTESMVRKVFRTSNKDKS